MLNQAAYNSFSDQISDYLNTIKHLNLKQFICVGIPQVLIVQDFGNFELSPMIVFFKPAYTAILWDQWLKF